MGYLLHKAAKGQNPFSLPDIKAVDCQRHVVKFMNITQSRQNLRRPLVRPLGEDFPSIRARVAQPSRRHGVKLVLGIR